MTPYVSTGQCVLISLIVVAMITTYPCKAVTRFTLNYCHVLPDRADRCLFNKIIACYIGKYDEQVTNCYRTMSYLLIDITIEVHKARNVQNDTCNTYFYFNSQKITFFQPLH